MDKLIYNRDADTDNSLYNYIHKDNIRETNNIEFQLPSDLTINEFYLACKRLSSALGYSNDNVENTFDNEFDSKYTESIPLIEKESKKIKNHDTIEIPILLHLKILEALKFYSLKSNYDEYVDNHEQSLVNVDRGERAQIVYDKLYTLNLE
jgi:hypothetical protein